MPNTTESTHAFLLLQSDSRSLFKLSIFTEQNITSGLKTLLVVLGCSYVQLKLNHHLKDMTAHRHTNQALKFKYCRAIKLGVYFSVHKSYFLIQYEFLQFKSLYCI